MIDRLGTWHAIALSEEVTATAPLGVHLGGTPIVLFRDGDGVARALEDRCVHRRVPMSMGRITPDGMIQCGYHGWTYEGATGQCRLIPNLRSDEPISPRYRLETYRAVEIDGFVVVASATSAVAAPAGLAGGPLHHHGTVTIATGHADYVAALLDGPEVLIDIPGVRITDYLLGDVTRDGDVLTSERSCVWPGLKLRAPFLWEQPLRLRTRIDLAAGFATLTLIDREEQSLMTAALAVAAGPRGTISVRWRASMAVAGRGMGTRWRWRALRGLSPIKVRSEIEGGRLAKLLVGPSNTLADTAPAARKLPQAA